MINISSYPSIAKCSVATLWGAFLLSVATLVICDKVGYSAKWILSIKALCFVLGLPCLVTIQYFVNSIGVAAKKHKIIFDNGVRRRIEPLIENMGEIQVGYYLSDEINAFAISSAFGDQALIAFSSRMLNEANDQQLLSFAAHEIAHIKNGDSKSKTYILAFSQAMKCYPHLLSEISKSMLKYMAYSLAIVTGIAMIIFLIIPDAGMNINDLKSWIIPILVVLAWPVGVILAYICLNHFLEKAYFAYSRDREFVADLDGAKLTSPEEMISALSILSCENNNEISVFDTHPPLDVRKERLAKLIEKK